MEGEGPQLQMCCFTLPLPGGLQGASSTEVLNPPLSFLLVVNKSCSNPVVTECYRWKAEIDLLSGLDLRVRCPRSRCWQG